MKPVKTYILVADGAHARVYVNEGPGKGITDVPGFTHEVDLKESRDIDADRQGRSFDSGGEGRHAMEPPTDAKRHAKQEFHRAIAQQLEHAAQAGDYDRLVLVAPPATLGDLRQELSKNASDRIHGEIPKDLVKASEGELLVQLGTVMAV